MVFQSFNLFNNMTVLENCMVGPIKVLGKKPEEARATAMRFLEKVGMAPYVNARPRQLSGGMKQRCLLYTSFQIHFYAGKPADMCSVDRVLSVWFPKGFVRCPALRNRAGRHPPNRSILLPPRQPYRFWRFDIC